MAYVDPRPEAVMDIECYVNYFLVMFRDVERGRTKAFELYDGCELDRPGIARLLRQWRVVTFNGNSYDMPMLALAMSGAGNEDLKKASDRVIMTDMRPWQFEDHYGVKLPGYLDHVDLIEVAPGMASLKIYGGRLHSERMQDLPIEPHERISSAQRDQLRTYCANDLQTTVDLLTALRQQLDLRAKMSDEYGLDLRSKSDAQVAEAVIRRQCENYLGRRLYKPDIDYGARFRYRPPQFIQYQTDEMRDLLERVRTTDFEVDHRGGVIMPKVLDSAKIPIGKGVYRMGIGGLHSSEKTTAHVSDDEFVLIDRDVASYYPMLILGSRLAPRQIGDVFLRVFKGHVEARLACKRAGDKVGANSRKIMVNGTFGKLGSAYSVFYSPDLMIQVTVTGQLALLLLIETIELAGIEVVSANTDGLVSKVPRSRIDDFNALIFDWEMATGFETEETRYRALYSRDVNNYIAITESGKVKTKGAYADEGLMKNPANTICVDATVAYLRDGVPLHETIEACEDIRKFVNVRQVKGGAIKGDGYLGKAIRWYYAEGERGSITYRTNGNNVPRSEGARPLMQLPDRFPDDVDFEWYIREARGILADIGVTDLPPDRRVEVRSGLVLARRPDAKNIHTVDLSTGVALCGDSVKGRHDKWVEYVRLPAGHRECSKCVKTIGVL